MKFLIKPDNEKVLEYYKNHSTFHNGDSGLDLFCIMDATIKAHSLSNKIHLGIYVAAYTNANNSTGFYLFPRSSMGSKTPLRLSNSVGIIDASYRGELIALVDNISDTEYEIKRGERYFQICAPMLESVSFELTDSLDETERGSGGFGSTGN